jgi:hypothetical protein
VEHHNLIQTSVWYRGANKLTLNNFFTAFSEAFLRMDKQSLQAVTSLNLALKDLNRFYKAACPTTVTVITLSHTSWTCHLDHSGIENYVQVFITAT